MIRSARFSFSRVAAVALAIAVAAVGSIAATPFTPSAPARAVSLAPTRLASTTADGTPADWFCNDARLSADGRYLVFASIAPNLPSGGTSVWQIYRKDLQTGEVVLVSASSSGAPGDDDSNTPSISDDGRYVAFVSHSPNLGVRRAQIFVRDVVASKTFLVSRNLTSAAEGDAPAHDPRISGDGAHIVFASEARNLVDGASPAFQQIYEASLTAGLPTLMQFVSLQDSGRSPTPDLASAHASGPAVSRDGSRVVFSSEAVNLTRDRPTGAAQVWMHDMNTGATVLVSRSALVADSGADGLSYAPSITADGTKVAFESRATDLQSPVTPMPQVYLRDLNTRETSVVSVDRLGTGLGDGPSTDAEISADGTAVAFVSSAANLGPENVGTEWQVFRRDLVSKTTTLWSTRPRSNDAPNVGVDSPTISGDGRTIAFATGALDLVDEEVPDDTSEIYLRAVAEPAVVRLGGANRFDTAANVAADTFGSERPVVYVATGADFADALSASAAAGAGGGPVLLVTKDAIPSSVSAQLDRLQPAAIILVGGPNSVSPTVEAALQGYGPVQRLGGPDRFAVSALVSRTAFPSTPVSTVYLASGTAFPDALGGAAATHGRGPVLLVTKDAVPAKIAAELARLAPSNIVVLGGRNAISDAVVATLPSSATVTRIGGADRFVVSAAVSAASFDPHVDTVYVASGAAFPDALSGSAAAIALHAPVLLVTHDTIPAAIATELTRLKPHRIVALGGTSALSDAVTTQLAGYLAR